MKSSLTLINLAILLISVLAAGCSPEPTRRVTRTNKSGEQTSEEIDVEEEFANGREMLFNLYNFDSKEGSLRCALFFSQWLEAQSAGAWKPDPLVDELPERWRESSLLRNLKTKKLIVDDVEYMESAVWMRDIARWLSKSAMDEPIEQWIDQQELGADANRLKLAFKLFDWTIRNVQLLPPPGGPSQPPPGAARMVRIIMLLGLGDAMERARIFLGLCRQAEIPAVMLAKAGEETEQQPHCVAVLLGGKLYLFDTQLGIPIPLEDDSGIATLSQVQDNPQLLEALSLGESLPYPFQAERFKDVVALVEAAPEALSLRMHLIQQRLTGEHRLTLAADPTAVARQLAKLEIKTRLWTAPFEAVRFEKIVEREIKRNPTAEAQFQRGQALFVGTTPLIMGRKLHLHGQFSKEGTEPGAKQRYMAVRYADQQLRDLLTDRELQAAFGLEKGTYERDDEFAMRLRAYQSQLIEAKMHASFWIGIVHFEEGNYESAARWFGTRVMEENPTSLWFQSARYNLGRTYERLGKLEDARELYLEDDSIQQHGSLLRARRLAKLVK